MDSELQSLLQMLEVLRVLEQGESGLSSYTTPSSSSLSSKSSPLHYILVIRSLTTLIARSMVSSILQLFSSRVSRTILGLSVFCQTNVQEDFLGAKAPPVLGFLTIPVAIFLSTPGPSFLCPAPLSVVLEPGALDDLAIMYNMIIDSENISIIIIGASDLSGWGYYIVGDQIIIGMEKTKVEVGKKEGSKYEKLNRKFLEMHEGFKKVGYVPDPQKSGKDFSGVTIGCGVDLRFQTAKELRDSGLDEGIIEKLEPFMEKGLMGDKAREKLKKVKLELKEEEARAVSEAVRYKYYRMLKGQLKREEIDVETLPECLVDVLYSRTYHSGSITNKKILQCLKEKKYKEIPKLIREDNPNFSSRLDKEAKYIEQKLT